MTAPLIFLVAHVTYIGPVVLLVILRYRRFVKTAIELGPGVSLAALIMAALAIVPETRTLLSFVPLLVVITARNIDSTITRNQLLSVMACCLWWSKIWLPINLDALPGDRPLPMFFMHSGPWMPVQMYYWQALAMIVTIVVLLLTFRNKRQVQAGEMLSNSQVWSALMIVLLGILPVTAYCLGISHRVEIERHNREPRLERVLFVGPDAVPVYPATCPLLGAMDDSFLFVFLYDHADPSSAKMWSYLRQTRERYGNQIGFVCLPVSSRAHPNARRIDKQESRQFARLAAAVWCIDRTKYQQFNDRWADAGRDWRYHDAWSFAKQLTEPEAIRQVLDSRRPDSLLALADRIYFSMNSPFLPMLIARGGAIEGLPSRDFLFQLFETRLKVKSIGS